MVALPCTIQQVGPDGSFAPGHIYRCSLSDMSLGMFAVVWVRLLLAWCFIFDWAVFFRRPMGDRSIHSFLRYAIG